jgi:hypothetical protein
MSVGVLVQHTIDEDRCRFERQLVGALEVLAQFAGAVFPSNLQLGNIGAIDLADIRVARATGIAAIPTPLRHVVDIRIGGERTCSTEGSRNDTPDEKQSQSHFFLAAE